MNAWPLITTDAVQSRLSPASDSASTWLLAYLVLSWCTPGSSSTMVPANAGDRSVVTSAGSPWARITVEKNPVAAFTSRLVETYTSMTCPCWSTARYTYLHVPATFT